MRLARYVRYSVAVTMQVVELALVKLFENLNMEDLVVTMSELIVASHATPPNSSPTATPPTRGSITVSLCHVVVVCTYDHYL